MIEFYPEIRLVHIGSVIASGSLFALRGALALAGSPLARHPVARFASYSIDTVLLTAALMLLSVLHLNPIRVPWLATKLCLLVAYVVLGSFALKRARTPGMRLLCLVAALLTFAAMAGIARAHHPAGWLLPALADR